VPHQSKPARNPTNTPRVSTGDTHGQHEGAQRRVEHGDEEQHPDDDPHDLDDDIHPGSLALSRRRSDAGVTLASECRRWHRAAAHEPLDWASGDAPLDVEPVGQHDAQPFERHLAMRPASASRPAPPSRAVRGAPADAFVCRVRATGRSPRRSGPACACRCVGVLTAGPPERSKPVELVERIEHVGVTRTYPSIHHGTSHPTATGANGSGGSRSATASRGYSDRRAKYVFVGARG